MQTHGTRTLLGDTMPARTGSAGTSEPDSGATSGGTRATGVWLLVIRLAWIAIAVAAVALTVVGVPVRRDALYAQYQGDIGVIVTKDAVGNAVLQTWSGAAAADAGILSGDILVAINGTPVPRDANATEMLNQRVVGLPMTLSYRTGQGDITQATIIPAGEQAGLLTPAHLSVAVLTTSALAVDSLAGLLCFVVAAVIFWRKSDDWLAVFVSLTLLLAFAPTAGSVLTVLSTLPPVWLTVDATWLSVAVSCLVLVFYLFPDGRLVPRWTRAVAVLVGVWTVGFPLMEVAYQQAQAASTLSATPWLTAQTASAIAIISLVGLLGSGVVAQIARFQRWASPVQQQQTKWVVWGAGIAALAVLGQAVSTVSVVGTPYVPASLPLADFVAYPAARLLQTLLPLSLALAVLRYRLWDIDVIIRRTLIYGTLVAILALLYGGAVLVVQVLSQGLTGPQPGVVIVVITLSLTALLAPLRRRIQEAVDRRFYRERVDVRAALTAFAGEVRTLIELPELLGALVTRTTDLLHITHGAVFLAQPDGTFSLAAARGLAHHAPPLPVGAELRVRLEGGLPLAQADSAFPLLVPLTLPGGSSPAERTALVGVLALGPRRSEQAYSRDDQALLASLAGQAGTALHVAQLIAEKGQEAERRAESDRQLAVYRASPMGQAEALAAVLSAKSETALVALYTLAQRAGHDADAAALLGHLPQALAQRQAPDLAALAEGMHYLVAGQATPEMVPAGVRLIVAHLEGFADGGWPGAAARLALYGLCQQALAAQTTGRIVELRPALQAQARSGRDQAQDEAAGPAGVQPGGLEGALGDLALVTGALEAYERVDTPDDRLAYLASAIERLGRVRRELGSADRALVARIVEGWLAVVTGAMRDVQTRAQISCTLLTRQSWQSAVVTLAVRVRNGGRAAALHLQVGCDPAPDYTVLDAPVELPRLAPGAEVQVELRVRPRLPDGGERFRARFSIHYGDPRDDQQVEVFADMITLLPVGQPFQTIASPYVVGTPLATGSPLFVGRADLFAFLQEHLAGAHRHNLVLIGQRRTGKTSLLKQLPRRLGEEVVAVYLDGQALGLDPGLANFVLSLSTEIADALADRGFSVAPPDAQQSAASPAASFERHFLARVRAAIGDRHLLLLLDECEELEGAVRRGTLDVSVFGFLRHLIQHTARFSMIFCGTHHLEDLTADYWHVLFNIALHRQVGFLEQGEARRLIEEPVAAAGMRYDDLAIAKIWQATAGHPYFLQLLCHGLVQHQNKVQRSYVTVADVNAALEEMLATGEAHFMYLWTESTPDERLALATLSRILPHSGAATATQVRGYLQERGVVTARQSIEAALQRLALRQVIASTGDADEPAGVVYQWKLGLIGLWVEAYRPLGAVIEEVRP